jgi:hypothetical protein
VSCRPIFRAARPLVGPEQPRRPDRDQRRAVHLAAGELRRLGRLDVPVHLHRGDTRLLQPGLDDLAAKLRCSQLAARRAL